MNVSELIAALQRLDRPLLEVNFYGGDELGLADIDEVVLSDEEDLVELW